MSLNATLNATGDAVAFANVTLANLTAINRGTVLLTLLIYDNPFLRTLGIDPKYVPSAALITIAMATLAAGSYASLKKPKNAEEPNPHHPLFDPSDVEIEISELEANSMKESNALAMPVLLGAVLLALNYGLKSLSRDTILCFFSRYILLMSVFSNYSTLGFLLKTANRKVSHKLRLNPSTFVGKYRFTFAVDPHVSGTGIVPNEEKIEEEQISSFNSLFSLFGSSFKLTRTPKKELSKKQKNARKELKKLTTTIDGDDQLINVFFSTIEVVSLPLSLALSYVYYANDGSKNWLLSTIFGSSFAIFGIKSLRISSIKAGLILLTGLFFYDIFFVFGTDVMVTVAKELDIPAKLSFPAAPVGPIGADFAVPAIRLSMLGLGDIVVPGMFISLCLRFDLFNHHEAHPKTEFHRLAKFKKPYFKSSFVGYALGLLVTTASLHYFEAAQPALLYLCPSIIFSVFVTALFKGQVRKLWHFSEEDKEDQEDKDEDKDESGTEDGKGVKKVKYWSDFLNLNLAEEAEEEDETYVLTAEDEIDEADDTDDFSEYDDDEGEEDNEE